MSVENTSRTKDYRKFVGDAAKIAALGLMISSPYFGRYNSAEATLREPGFYCNNPENGHGGFAVADSEQSPFPREVIQRPFLTHVLDPNKQINVGFALISHVAEVTPTRNDGQQTQAISMPSLDPKKYVVTLLVADSDKNDNLAPASMLVTTENPTDAYFKFINQKPEVLGEFERNIVKRRAIGELKNWINNEKLTFDGATIREVDMALQRVVREESLANLGYLEERILHLDRSIAAECAKQGASGTIPGQGPQTPRAWIPAAPKAGTLLFDSNGPIRP